MQRKYVAVMGKLHFLDRLFTVDYNYNNKGGGCMETKRNHDLSEEELAQVRKAMEDFRNTPVVKEEEPEPPAEPPEKPIKKRKKWIAWTAVAAVMLAVAIVLVMWFNRY